MKGVLLLIRPICFLRNGLEDLSGTGSKLRLGWVAMTNFRLFLFGGGGVGVGVWVMFFYLFFLSKPFLEFSLLDIKRKEALIFLILVDICLHNYYIN